MHNLQSPNSCWHPCMENSAQSPTERNVSQLCICSPLYHNNSVCYQPAILGIPLCSNLGIPFCSSSLFKPGHSPLFILFVQTCAFLFVHPLCSNLGIPLCSSSLFKPGHSPLFRRVHSSLFILFAQTWAFLSVHPLFSNLGIPLCSSSFFKPGHSSLSILFVQTWAFLFVQTCAFLFVHPLCSNLGIPLCSSSLLKPGHSPLFRRVTQNIFGLKKGHCVFLCDQISSPVQRAQNMSPVQSKFCSVVEHPSIRRHFFN